MTQLAQSSVAFRSTFQKHPKNPFCSLYVTPKIQIKMKAFFAVLALAAVAQAGVVVSPAATTLISSPVAVARSVVAAPATISRVPSLDSAVIQSDRIGGNFAYSVSEAHAHAITQPIIQHVAQPVAVSHQVVAAPQVVAHSVVAPQQVVVGRSILAHSGLSVAGLPAGTVLLK